MSCSARVVPAAGLWFVNTEGQAIRLAWPTEPCGYQQEPLEPLRALKETSRIRQSTGIDTDTAAFCPRLHGPLLTMTTDDDVKTMEDRSMGSVTPAERAMTRPVEDVGRLLVCRYVVDGEEFSPKSSVRLSREESIELARAVTAAPIAPPCTRSASRVVHTELLRADGSGGATVFVELDGCGRVYLDGYRTLAPDQVAILSR